MRRRCNSLSGERCWLGNCLSSVFSKITNPTSRRFRQSMSATPPRWWLNSPNHRYASPGRGILKPLSPYASPSPHYVSYTRRRRRSTPSVHYADSPRRSSSGSFRYLDLPSSPFPVRSSPSPSNLDLPEPTHSIWNFPTGVLRWSKHSMSPMDVMASNTPGPYVPAICQPPAPLQLHPCLQPNPLNNRIPKIQWDLWQKPTTATYYTSRQCSIPLNHNLPATYPEMPEVHISLEGISNYLLPCWSTWVYVRSPKPVTIGDILQAIYDFFQNPLTDDEYAYFVELHPDNAENIELCFEQRCTEVPGLIGYEDTVGVRRVDLLGGLNRGWQGLTVQLDGTLKAQFGLPFGSSWVP